MKKKRTTASQPTQLSLLSHVTYSPMAEPKREVSQFLEVQREDAKGQLVPVRSEFTIRMPGANETLPMIHHRHILDAFVRDLTRLGLPEDGIIPFSPATTLRDAGLSPGGENYKTIYDTITKYWRMEITFNDQPGQLQKRRGVLPYLTGVRIISSFNVPKPGSEDQTGGTGGWIKFEKWFVDGLRDKGDLKYLPLAILQSFKVGETRRIYEVVKKFMGDKPMFKIGIGKLSEWIPYERNLDTKRKVEKTKRAIKQLLEIQAFPNIEVAGRGDAAIVTFWNYASQDGANLVVPAEATAAPAINQADAPYTRGLSQLRQLMTLEAKAEGRLSAAAFQKDLAETDAVYAAVLDKYAPSAQVILELLEDARVALREGRIKSSVRQFFVDSLGRATGKK